MGYSKSSSIWEVYSNKCPYKGNKKDLRQPDFTLQRTRGKKQTAHRLSCGHRCMAWVEGRKGSVDNVRRMSSIGGWVVTKGSGLTIFHDVEE